MTQIQSVMSAGGCRCQSLEKYACANQTATGKVGFVRAKCEIDKVYSEGKGRLGWI